SPVALGTLGATTVTISGHRSAGSALTASSSTALAPAEKTTFQWSRNQTPIAGATQSIYVPRPSDVGANIAVTATSYRTGFKTTSASKSAGPIAPAVAGTAPAFGQLMQPSSKSVVPSSVATV